MNGLDNDTLSVIMNVVHLEGAITSLEKIKSSDTDPKTKYKYDVKIKGYKEKLNEITNQVSPRAWLGGLRIK